MKKPTIYLDTNIVSALHYDGSDINTLSRRMVTRDWWDVEQANFTVWASSFTELELAQGVYRQQAECLRFVRRMKYVPITAGWHCDRGIHDDGNNILGATDGRRGGTEDEAFMTRGTTSRVPLAVALGRQCLRLITTSRTDDDTDSWAVSDTAVTGRGGPDAALSVWVATRQED